MDTLSLEKHLRYSEKRFRTLFESASDAIFTIRDGCIDTCNRRALEIYGFTEKEFIGANPGQFSPQKQPDGSDSLLKAQDKICSALKGPPQIFEWLHRRSDGTLFNAEVSLSRFDYHGGTEVLAIVRDITERKKAEEALKASEIEKSLILDSIVDLVVYHDLDMRILWANREARESVRMTHEEMVGRHCWEIWHNRTEACIGCPVLLARETGEPQKAEIDSPDGRWWFIRGFPVKGDDGSVSAIVEFCLDITDRKRAEETIEILNTNLASHAMELEAANSELEAFNYTVSHDLRAPLTVITGYCGLLRESCSRNMGKKYVAHMEQISSAAKQMDQLIGTLLNFSRLSRCQMKEEPVDLSSLAGNIAERLKIADFSRQVTFTLEEGIMVSGDAKLLEVAMENLLGNAWKYTRMQENPIIEFGRTVVDGQTACFVRDNGLGFHMSQVDKLFKPFVRLQEATELSGFGIGLATVHRIIQRHGGRIWAEGEPGKGATFYFTL